MPYKALSDLPDSVPEYLPMHAQKIYWRHLFAVVGSIE